jgi:hypothetical protein
MIGQRTMSADRIFITVEKYHMNGRMNRIVLKSAEGNYLLDLSLHSFLERSIIMALISMVRAVSFVIPTYHMNINKYNLKEG